MFLNLRIKIPITIIGNLKLPNSLKIEEINVNFAHNLINDSKISKY